MNRWLFISLLPVFTWFFHHVTFHKAGLSVEIQEVFVFDKNSGENLSLQKSPGARTFSFPPPDYEGDWLAYHKSESGISPEPVKITPPENSESGFLAYPDNGSFFIWYPQLGSKIAFFNEKGDFLMEREETRYLEVSPDGRYLLAAAGDHSRAEFTNPNLDPIADVEGLIFHQWSFARNHSSGIDACIFFLSGEMAAFDLQQKKRILYQFPGMIKSGTCEYDNEFALIHYRNPQNPQTDIISRLNLKRTSDFLQFSQKPQTLYQIPQAMTTTIPIAYSRETLLIVVPKKDHTVAQSIRHGKVIREYSLPAFSPQEWDEAFWYTQNGLIFLAAAKKFFGLSPDGIVWQENLPDSVVSLSGENSFLYLQHASGIFGLSVM